MIIRITQERKGFDTLDLFINQRAIGCQEVFCSANSSAMTENNDFPVIFGAPSPSRKTREQNNAREK